MEICDDSLMLWFGKDCEFSLHGSYIMEELRIGSWDPMTMKVCSQEGEPPAPGDEDLCFFSLPCLHCSTEKGN